MFPQRRIGRLKTGNIEQKTENEKTRKKNKN